jgi:hypothetical protein
MARTSTSQPTTAQVAAWTASVRAIAKERGIKPAHIGPCPRCDDPRALILHGRKICNNCSHAAAQEQLAKLGRGRSRKGGAQ